MGKYKGKTNEDRQRQSDNARLKCCAIPASAREALQRAAVAMQPAAAQGKQSKASQPSAIDSFLAASSILLQKSALKSLGKTMSAAARGGSGREQLGSAGKSALVKGLVIVLFDDGCCEIGSTVVPVLAALDDIEQATPWSASGAPLRIDAPERRCADSEVVAAIELHCAAYMQEAAKDPKFEQVPILAALLTLKPAEGVVRGGWTAVLRAFMRLADRYMDCKLAIGGTFGGGTSALAEATCSRHLLEALKFTAPLFKLCDGKIRQAVQAVAANGVADDGYSCVIAFMGCMHRLLTFTSLPRDCCMAAGAGTCWLLSVL